MAKVVNKIKREAGSTVVLDGVTYRFSADNEHTAEVDNPSHLERFRSIGSFVVIEDAAPSEDGAVSSAQPETKPKRLIRQRR
jgi:hypothetical protein